MAAPLNSVQSIGNFNMSFVHPLIAGGAAITLGGFKLDEQFLDSVQQIMNSKVIALVGGGSATLTNSVKIGKLTLNATRISVDPLDGDIISIAQALQSLADSVGGVLRVSYSLNGQLLSVTFTGVTVESVPPIKLSGNDLPTYPVTFNYGGYV